MSMEFSTRQVDGVTIVDLKGRITLGEGSATLRDSGLQSLGLAAFSFNSLTCQNGQFIVTIL